MNFDFGSMGQASGEAAGGGSVVKGRVSKGQKSAGAGTTSTPGKKSFTCPLSSIHLQGWC